MKTRPSSPEPDAVAIGMTLGRWVAIVLVASLVLAVSPGFSGSGLAQKGPVMEIEPEVHDFGGVRQDQELKHAFTITNSGSATLEIRRISTSCGCAAAVPETDVVQPGESTTLLVTLSTRKYKGVLEKSVSVASNDSKRVRTIKVQAFVEVPE